MRLLKFYTPHCVHCPNVTKFLNDNKIEHESIDLFEYPEKSVQYKVLGVPTLLVLDDEGKEKIRHVGGRDFDKFLQQEGFIKGE